MCIVSDYYWIIFSGMNVSQLIHPWKDIWSFSQRLATVKEAVVNIVYRFLCENSFSFLWDKTPVSVIAGYMVVACLVLQKSLHCFPEWSCHFTFPPASMSGPASLQPV